MGIDVSRDNALRQAREEAASRYLEVTRIQGKESGTRSSSEGAQIRDRPVASPPPPAPPPIYNVVVDKESIPSFRGDTPVAQPLRRNQEVKDDTFVRGSGS